MKNQKGITLIALVITIIVMLILVVVTVSFALGDDGVIGNARTAKAEQQKATVKEAITLAKADLISTLLNPNTTEAEKTEIKGSDSVEAAIEKYTSGIQVTLTPVTNNQEPPAPILGSYKVSALTDDPNTAITNELIDISGF